MLSNSSGLNVLSNGVSEGHSRTPRYLKLGAPTPVQCITIQFNFFTMYCVLPLPHFILMP